MQVDVAEGRVRVAYDGTRTGPQAIRRRLQQAGYGVGEGGAPVLRVLLDGLVVRIRRFRREGREMLELRGEGRGQVTVRLRASGLPQREISWSLGERSVLELPLPPGPAGDRTRIALKRRRGGTQRTVPLAAVPRGGA